MDTERAANILLVEDNHDHAELTLKALKKGNLTSEIFWVKDGQEALDFLQGQQQYAAPGTAPRPALILLDIHLPKVNGYEVLRHIKSDPALHTIPVVMLTTSNRADDVSATYGAGANSYVTKPVSSRQFVEQVKALQLYWLLTSQLPES
jgi:CheY-like chemotaxis protein